MKTQSPLRFSFFSKCLFILLLGGTLMSCASNRPNYLGVTHGKLAPCPTSPNCVCSYNQDAHHIAPLEFSSSFQNARHQMKQLVTGLKGFILIHEEEDYLRFEFMSAIFKFVDDVEFYFDGQSQLIHVRSASRVGYYDFGANRKRIENIRQLWNGSIRGVIDGDIEQML